MTHLVKQPAFSGPLDLLLQLIERTELDITSIALAEVTDEYVARVKDLERRQLPEITDFLVIAARLLLLKSRALLPVSPDQTEEPDDLAWQLAEYKLYKEAAHSLGEQLGTVSFSAGKPPSLIDARPATMTEGVDQQILWQSFNEVLDRLPDPRTLPEASIEDRLTIEECVSSIKQKLGQGPQPFDTLFGALRSRVAVIVTFLAILELIKQQLLSLTSADKRLMVNWRS